jgi:hypothetical protein
MKNTFSEYHPLNTEVIEQLWEDAIFIFDTNVLLNLYRYSKTTSDKFIQIISNLNNRIWIPFQVGLEFNKNRLIVLSDQKKKYVTFKEKIHDLIGEIENKNRNPFFSEELTEKIVAIKNDFETEISQKIKDYDDSLVSDPILVKINSAFEKKVGNYFNEDEIVKVQKEGEKRYKNKIPPGYCDMKKPENVRYGDLLIWKQIMQKSKEANVDIIFVLDDRKEDWWFEHQGKTISPRPELLKEFRTETEKNIHFYNPFQFLKYSNKYLNSAINKDVIEEVRQYKEQLVKHDNFIQINLTLQGDLKDFNLFFNDIKNTGYNVLAESNHLNDIHYLNITLPNIPDLERRLNSKYISKLSAYDLSLIDSES